ncbi:hypothetical protein ASPZODRAFT_131634 [Penicilliopsis zonata CBS 506.65]|uniref:Glutamine amidotransferase domain-containing protein n=1 Tax=Penicilliopsis zonata CBS 506.65 TaxID=1073090 RepID=A0A1L9SL46_9EURO|nr:hypothetical protein ASPZODRAFT_131634 [Penicilliopsis zonata CBS 506.65]OJJ47992.1 hypothetical protein ASPZODRAFT_131634 [Penicilliopsis zonata CBS 506.65]
MITRRIHIAVLDVDVPVPNVYAAQGLYSSQFRVLLQAAVARLNKASKLATGPIAIHTTAYDAVGGALPPLQGLRSQPRGQGTADPENFRCGPLGAIDAVLITGSSASVYAFDKYPWIRPLQTFIQTVYAEFPHVKLFGSCFGHQLIAQALLSLHNPLVQPHEAFKVEACPLGAEVGIQPIKLHSSFVTRFPCLETAAASSVSSDSERDFCIQLIHLDRVVPEKAGVLQDVRSSDLCMPSSDETNASMTLPSGWISIGGSAKCPIQGLYNPRRVLTYQGHFEFDSFVTRETCVEFARRLNWPAADVQDYLACIDRACVPGSEDADDSKLAAEVVVLFFAGEDAGSQEILMPMETGILTPPLEIQ